MWRDASEADDEVVEALCLALNREDPGPQPVSAAQVRATLRTLRSEPMRGKTVVLEIDGIVRGYALLVSFWSNELGGEVCNVDELYVAPAERSKGHGGALFEQLPRLWGRPTAAVALETMPANERARAFYRRIGFQGENVALVRRVDDSVGTTTATAAPAAPNGLPIFQFAYVVDDLERAAERWAATMGAGPFFVAAHHRADWFEYRGRPIEADVSYAFGYSGGTQIQLVVQHDDQPSIYREMFPTGGGLHHIASLVVDYDRARQRLLDQGHALACELDANDIHACYFDCRSTLDCFVELHSYTDRIAATFARWRRVHEEWDGTGGALRHHTSGT